MVSYFETRLFQSLRGFDDVCHCMIAMNPFVHIIVEGLDTYLDSGNTHREHVVYVVSSRPVGPSLDRDSDIFDLSVLCNLLGFIKRSSLLVVESVQASLDEFFLIRARQKRKRPSYQDQLHLVDKVGHVP